MSGFSVHGTNYTNAFYRIPIVKKPGEGSLLRVGVLGQHCCEVFLCSLDGHQVELLVQKVEHSG
jgi:hypothetical protein